MPCKTKKLSVVYFFSRGGGRSIAVIIIGVIILGGVLFKAVIFKNNTDPNAINKQQIGNAARGVLSQEDINRLPDTFYREDIPRDILEKFPKEIIDRLPSRSKSTPIK